jgi:hypothetical protein
MSAPVVDQLRAKELLAQIVQDFGRAVAESDFAQAERAAGLALMLKEYLCCEPRRIE